MWRQTLFNPVVFGLALLSAGCAAQSGPAIDAVEAIDPPVLAVGQAPSLRKTLDALPDDRIVFVGETHTRYDHHLVQLEVLKFMQRKFGDVALGVEWFQFPFQQALDDYVAGRITEAQMLARTGYFDRWQFDYRLYRPIMQYARDAGIPIVALNAPVELTRQIGQGGLDSLTADARAMLPHTYGPVGARYRARVREAFDAHPPQGQSFDHFFTVMQTWDETMAKRAADHLDAHPGRRLVVLAGSGHVMFGDGIPERLERRTGIRGARLLVGAEHAGTPGVADFIVLSQEQMLPPAGMLGVFLDSQEGSVKVKGLTDSGALKAAGLEKDDVILAIDDTPTPDFATLKLVLLGRAPGEQIMVRYRHEGELAPPVENTVAVTLGDAKPRHH